VGELAQSSGLPPGKRHERSSLRNLGDVMEISQRRGQLVEGPVYRENPSKGEGECAKGLPERHGSPLEGVKREIEKRGLLKYRVGGE